MQHFAGNHLNRQSHLRGDVKIRDTLKLARFVLLNQLNFLKSDAGRLALITCRDIPEIESLSTTENTYYLGLDQDLNQHYWTMDISSLPEIITKSQALYGSFQHARPSSFNLPKFDASIYSLARSIVDWNQRMKFCPNCSKPMKSMDSGFKRSCGNTVCESTKSIQNYSYPRTDPVVIVAITNSSKDKILLGRQSKFPPRLYSCIAGFVEPGETLEEACGREAKEETGILVENVLYHTSQPWPFPSQLMIGCFATAKTENIHLHDQELEAAEWFSREQILMALRNEPGATVLLPPSTAIAHSLIKAWAESLPNPSL